MWLVQSRSDVYFERRGLTVDLSASKFRKTGSVGSQMEWQYVAPDPDHRR
jgi:hypothetical protein